MPEEIKDEEEKQQDDMSDGLMDIILNIRMEARKNKDFKTSDMIRDQLADMKIQIKDTKDGSEWSKAD